MQVEAFIVVKSGLTLYGMYKQCLRELNSRWVGLRSRMINMERVRIKIDRALADGDELKALDAQEMKLGLEQMQLALPDRVREFSHFYALAVRMKEELGELTVERRAELDEEMFRTRMKWRAAAELQSDGRISRGTLQSVWSMHRDRDQLLSEMKDGDRLVKWWREFRPELPDYTLTGELISDAEAAIRGTLPMVDDLRELPELDE